MPVRPRYQAVPTYSDTLLEAAGWIGLAVLWVVAGVHFPRLPATIPVHFNFNGEADNFGGKEMIWLLPAIGTVVLAGITLLSRYPHVFNYPQTITERNAAAQYRNAIRMMRVVKLSVIVTFLVILLHTISVASGRLTAWAGPWTFYAALLLLLLPVIYFVIKGLNIKPS